MIHGGRVWLCSCAEERVFFLRYHLEFISSECNRLHMWVSSCSSYYIKILLQIFSYIRCLTKQYAVSYPRSHKIPAPFLLCVSNAFLDIFQLQQEILNDVCAPGSECPSQNKWALALFRVTGACKGECTLDARKAVLPETRTSFLTGWMGL